MIMVVIHHLKTCSTREKYALSISKTHLIRHIEVRLDLLLIELERRNGADALELFCFVVKLPVECLWRNAEAGGDDPVDVRHLAFEKCLGRFARFVLDMKADVAGAFA